MIQIKVDSEAVDLLYKYCNKSPAEVPLVMTRLLREWVKMGAKKWYRNPELIPNMPPIPESRMTTVGVSSIWGRSFKNTIKEMNKKDGIDIHEDKLASILLAAYIKVYNIKGKGSWYKARKWGNPG